MNVVFSGTVDAAQQARIAVEAEAIKQAPANPQNYIAPRSLLEAALKVKPR